MTDEKREEPEEPDVQPANRGTGEREDHRQTPPGHEIPEVEGEWEADEPPARTEDRDEDVPDGPEEDKG